LDENELLEEPLSFGNQSEYKSNLDKFEPISFDKTSFY